MGWDYFLSISLFVLPAYFYPFLFLHLHNSLWMDGLLPGL
jgi:hypothetical protein